jgi:hypothetical protein
MSDDRARYLESGAGAEPADRERLDAVLAILRERATWADPPPEVTGLVMDEITASSRSFVRRRPAWVGVAVILGALVVALAAAATGVFAEPDETLVAMKGTELEAAARGEAAIRETETGWWIRLEVDGLPPAPADAYYEGWMWNDQGQGVSIGTFHLQSDAAPVILWSGVDPEEYPSIWITLEDEDGNPAASDAVVMRGRAEG